MTTLEQNLWNGFTGILTYSIVIFLMMYGLLFIIGRDKLANKFARWVGKTITKIAGEILTVVVKNTWRLTCYLVEQLGRAMVSFFKWGYRQLTT